MSGNLKKTNKVNNVDGNTTNYLKNRQTRARFVCKSCHTDGKN